MEIDDDPIIQQNPNKSEDVDALKLKLATKIKFEESLLFTRKLTTKHDFKDVVKNLTLDDISNYAERISGSTVAPPETNNIYDPVQHQSIYPNYHFLNFVSFEEMLQSRLWDIISWKNVCFPPMIELVENYDTKEVEMLLTCSTKESNLYFKIDEGPFILYKPCNKYIFNSGKHIIQAYAEKQNYKNSKMIFKHFLSGQKNY